MNRFNAILARMCAQSGGAYVHIDCPEGEAPDSLGAVIGEENLAILREDHEVQILPAGNPAECGSRAREMFGMAVAILSQAHATGANALCITSSGQVTTWYEGSTRMEKLDEDTLMVAFRQRNANAIASAG